VKEDGIIEFKSFEEKVKDIKLETEKNQQLLKERVRKLIAGSQSKEQNQYLENQDGGKAKINHYLKNRLQKEQGIIAKIHEHREDIFEIKSMVSDHRIGIENMFYRFYHTSFKAYDLQAITDKMVKLFCFIGECRFRDLNSFYIEIVSEGIDKKFDLSHNNRWSYETRPILEAFFHSYHLLEMMEKYGLEMDPNEEPSPVLYEGWASVLYLYNIR
jgi:hypothetical protein